MVNALGVEADERAQTLPLDELGWVNVNRNAPEYTAMREYLSAHNGIHGLEVFTPDQIDDITRVFYRDGFVVVKEALTPQQLDFMRGGVDRVVHQMMAHDKHRVGNRGSHRYSFGGASLSGHLVHEPEWAMLIDLPTVTPILKSLFGSKDYIARGGGGDFCLPGTVEYQPLHADMSDRRTGTRPDGTAFTFGSFHDPRGILTYRDLPCPYICCNYAMVDMNPINGPIRQIPGTQHTRETIPSLDDEPEWMKLSTVCPAPAGSVIIRDIRCWHGGTPNLSDEVRALPNCEYYAPWFREPMRRALPREVWETLSDHAQTICRYIVADPDEAVVTGVNPTMGVTPIRDPNASQRR